MSASCVINRGEVLSAIDDVIDNLPDEIADAEQVIDRAQAKIAEGEAEAAAAARRGPRGRRDAGPHSEIVRVAEEQAAKIRADAEEEAAALRRETDLFIDSRMASFESVLHKTSSQVQTARARLAERSGLNTRPMAPTAPLPRLRRRGRREAAGRPRLLVCRRGPHPVR